MRKLPEWILPKRGTRKRPRVVDAHKCMDVIGVITEFVVRSPSRNKDIYVEYAKMRRVCVLFRESIDLKRAPYGTGNHWWQCGSAHCTADLRRSLDNGVYRCSDCGTGFCSSCEENSLSLCACSGHDECHSPMLCRMCDIASRGRCYGCSHVLCEHCSVLRCEECGDRFCEACQDSRIVDHEDSSYCHSCFATMPQ